MAMEHLRLLLKKYENKPKILQKINNFMEHKFPKQVSAYVDKELRKETLELETDKYISAFFNDPNTQFYYILASNTFIQYDGEHYLPVNEDEIWYMILSDITEKSVLLDWKYKVKTKIIKNIKERNILTSIPESDTIQFVLNFLAPCYFSTKEEAKYFLTCLGDNIFKKNVKQFNILNAKCKSFINAIQENCHYHFKNTINPIESFKYRYLEGEGNESRLLKLNIAQELDGYWKHFLKESILDIIAVSCHYSTRFENADNYIEKYCHHEDVRGHILYRHNNSDKQIVQDFIDIYIVKGNNEVKSSMHWDDLYFLWKEFLKTFDYPSFFVKDKLKKYLINNLEYDASNNIFKNISSKYLKYVRLFGLFWKETIHDASNNFFEISEICILYNDWIKERLPNEKCLNEKKMFSIIQYFYPQYQIDNSKYIRNISCTLWNKSADIKKTLEYLKCYYLPQKDKVVSFYDIYKSYCNYAKEYALKYIASKKYFEGELRKLIPSDFLSGDGIDYAFWKL